MLQIQFEDSRILGSRRGNGDIDLEEVVIRQKSHCIEYVRYIATQIVQINPTVKAQR